MVINAGAIPDGHLIPGLRPIPSYGNSSDHVSTTFGTKPHRLAIPWERTTDRQVSIVISLIRVNQPDRIGAMIQRTATHRSQDLAI
jgi:hypothetical protein